MEDIDTPTIANRINELQKQVQPYRQGYDPLSQYELPFSLSSPKLYLILPGLILLLLLWWRPNFLYNETINSNGQTVEKFSFKKLIVFWLIFSFCLDAGLFGYNYRKKGQT
jgi:hypothetical protein